MNQGLGSLFAMCGIVAIVARRPTRPVPAAADLLGLLDAAVAAPSVDEAAVAVLEVDRLLHGVPGMNGTVRTP